MSLDIMSRWTFFRDGMTATLSLHTLHVLLNGRAVGDYMPECPISSNGSLIALGICLILSTISMVQGSNGTWAYLVDIACFPIGIFFQIIVKPENWFLSLDPFPDCDLSGSSSAELAFLAGEILTFGVIPRLILSVLIQFKSRLARNLVYILLIGLAFLLVFSLNAIVNAIT